MNSYYKLAMGWRRRPEIDKCTTYYYIYEGNKLIHRYKHNPIFKIFCAVRVTTSAFNSKEKLEKAIRAKHANSYFYVGKKLNKKTFDKELFIKAL